MDKVAKKGTLHLHLLKGICLPALMKPNVLHMYRLSGHI